jgi:hypothetical protein
VWSEVDRVEGLKDIKDIVTIEDYSLYIFVLLVILALTILFFVIKKIINYKRVISPIKKAKKELKNLDLSDTKQSAYTLAKYAPLLSDEDLEYLNKYKYKKEVDSFSQEDLEKIKGFLNAI